MIKGASISVFGRRSVRTSWYAPIDVHVSRVARRYNLLERKPVDWQAAQELTDHLREFDPSDPVKYDFALFGMGVNNH